ncbi:SIR2 family NAD-dependent protein deacylase [Pengzhenrongella sicca]|uniref:SIR2 family protein n=1 Tax=Pengzhenrongella sicca TaxID=2819238 RepID=A0A8A4ZCV5_9MICO|nr:SIR2 family protein [Pengzhenrongella sicca]QTE29251.1 SIR2 family protein [Pengzhenrongella sicca]
MDDLGDRWRNEGLSVLVGAGLSMAPPSNVPSWMGFNEQLLTEMKSRLLTVLPTSNEVHEDVARLALARDTVTGFSEIVSDAFARDYWFDALRHLDGELPNAGHWALADLARRGTVRLIVTTNFDTLIERALGAAGVDHRVLVPKNSAPPKIVDDPSGLLVVKVHGSVERSASLVDLARQKASGIDVSWKSWLSRSLCRHPLLVAGFSGYDLTLGRDYLGLEAALAQGLSHVTWLSRDGHVLENVSRLLALAKEGRVVAADLPDFLLRFADGAPRSRVPVIQSPSVASWFDGSNLDPILYGVALARIMRVQGDTNASQRLRAMLRRHALRVPQEAETGAELATRAAVLAQMGADALGDLPDVVADDEAIAAVLRTAFEDLNNSLQLQSVLPEESSEKERLERRLNLSGTLVNLGRARVLVGDLAGAEVAAGIARTALVAVDHGAGAAMARRAQLRLLNGLVSAGRRDWRRAALAFLESRSLFVEYGDLLAADGAHTQYANALAKLGLERYSAWLNGTASDPSDPRIDGGPETNRTIRIEQLMEHVQVELEGDGALLAQVLWEVCACAEAPNGRLSRQMGDLRRKHGPPDLAALFVVVCVEALFGGRLAFSVSEIPDIPLPPGGPVPHLHPCIVDVAAEVARRIAQTGKEIHRSGDFGSAGRLFTVASVGFALVNDISESARAGIYAVDSHVRAGDVERAVSLLDALEASAFGSHVPPIIARRALVLEQRALAGDVHPREAQREIERLLAHPSLADSPLDSAVVKLRLATVLTEAVDLGRRSALLHEALLVFDGTEWEQPVRAAIDELRL